MPFGNIQFAWCGNTATVQVSSKHRGVGGVFFFIVGAEHSGGNSTVVAAEDAGLFTRFVANTDRPSVPIVDWVSNIDIIDEKLFHIASVVLVYALNKLFCHCEYRSSGLCGSELRVQPDRGRHILLW